MSRVFYPASRVEVGEWGDEDAFVAEDVDVWIEGAAILVSYVDDFGIVVLEGYSDDSGGWRLTARSRPRHATLEPIEGQGGRYKGSISEHGEEVRWTLVLGDPEIPT